MGCFGPEAPGRIDYGVENAMALQSQINLAPALYASEAQFQPQYTALELKNLQMLMGGTGGTPGLNQVLGESATAQRSADMRDVGSLGPQGRAAMLAQSPENALLMNQLNWQANRELAAGSNLTPDEARAMQQQSRAAFAARGMGGSNAGVGDELLRQFNLGQQLLRQRQAFAQQLVGTNQAIVGDPFQQVLGRNATGMGGALAAQQQAGSSLFNPEGGLGIAQTNYATRSQWEANRPSGMEKAGQVGKVIGSVAGGVAMAACWVAREVYGEDNPKWQQFRAWLLAEAPGWLRGLYLARGERFAGWVRRHPWVKPALRWGMDRAIDGGAEHPTSNELQKGAMI